MLFYIMINVNVINDKCIRVYTARRIKLSNSFISCVFYGFFNMICKPDFNNLQQICSSQLAASLPLATCSKSAVRNLQQACSSQLQQVFRSQLAASLLTTCSRLVIIKPEQAMRTHPHIGLMIATCSKSAADLLQLARFWLCRAG